jgi:hypothetical protein
MNEADPGQAEAIRNIAIKQREEAIAMLDDPTAYKIKRAGGGVYQVDIPDDAVAQMLDWDAPLTKQPAAVQSAVRERLKEMKYLRPDDDGPRTLQAAWKAYVNEKGGMTDGDTGATIYGALANDALRYDGNPINEVFRTLGQGADQQKAASLYLKSVGIPGIRYLDQGSRASVRGTRNFVVFDDQLPKILGRE